MKVNRRPGVDFPSNEYHALNGLINWPNLTKIKEEVTCNWR